MTIKDINANKKTSPIGSSAGSAVILIIVVLHAWIALLFNTGMVRGDDQLRVNNQQGANSNSPQQETADKLETTPKVGSYTDLIKHAQTICGKDFVPPPESPPVLSNMDYDTYRLIAFRNNRSIKVEQQQPYWIELFHKGYVQKNHVQLNLIQQGLNKSIPFSQDYFDYRGKLEGKLDLPADLGFAGIKLVGKYPGKDNRQEMMTFLGASYFRGIALSHVYGSSARGLAIDVGLPKAEEFPLFREFWVIPTNTSDNTLELLALLDSPSVTGAYSMLITPGDTVTSLDMKSTLFFRKQPEKVGIAPITSMWMWGDGLKGPAGDDRPEVHDADGLQIHTQDDKWIYRALCRQMYPSLVQFPLDSIKGFGLLQRDVDQKHYLDDEAKYHLRPGIWIETTNDWGKGRIELLELPSEHEAIDNIATWWVPEKAVEIGKPWELNYKLSFCTSDRADHRIGKAIGYRVFRNSKEDLRVEVDFTIPSELTHGKEIKPQVQVQTIRAFMNQGSCSQKENVYTASLELKPTGEGPVELSLYLQEEGKEITETWKYLCPVEAPPVALPPWRVGPNSKEE